MSPLELIKAPIVQELEAYTALFASTLQHENSLLGQALSHIRERRGKMMRPILTLLTAKELSGGRVGENALRAAATIELLHTASLVHDDVVDESGERRGQKSLHALMGNKVAVLVGDYLLSKSLLTACETGNLRLVEHIARLGGTLSEGEIAQLENVDRLNLTEDDYFRVIQHKTAELFAACTQLAAITCETSDEIEEKARRFGLLVGLCFQIRDDIFDYFPSSDAVALGKPAKGADMREGKLTLPAIYVLRKYPHDAPLQETALRIKKLEATDAEIADFIEQILTRGGIEYARRRMEELRLEALATLSFCHTPELRDALTLYLDFVVGRGY